MVDPVLPKLNEDKYDRLVVGADGQPNRVVFLEKSTLVIGRDAGQDVVLYSKDVSRTHARLERTTDGRYHITDLDSHNGTWIGQTRLPPQTQQDWSFGQTLRIGPFWLQIEPARDDEATQSQLYDPRMLSTTTSTVLSQAALKMTMTELSVQPGQVVELPVEIVNHGIAADHFSVHLDKIPVEWIGGSSAIVYLLPNETARVSISIRLPRRPVMKIGRQPFEVQVRSFALNRVVASAAGELAIGALNDFSTDLYPRQLEERGATILQISNTGNVADTFTITARDPANALVFDVSHREVKVEAEQAQSVAIQVHPKVALKPGETRRFPFEVIVKSIQSEKTVEKAELAVSVPFNSVAAAPVSAALAGTPVKPPQNERWMAFVLAILLMVAVAVLLLATGSRSSTTDDQPPAVTTTPAADTWKSFDRSDIRLQLPQRFESSDSPSGIRDAVAKMGASFEPFAEMIGDEDFPRYDLLAFDPQSQPDFLTFVMIDHFDSPFRNSLQDILDHEFEGESGTMTVEKALVDVGDYPAARFEVRGEQIFGVEAAFEALQYQFIRAGRNWRVYFVTSAAEFEARLPVFEQAIRTLEFLNPEAAGSETLPEATDSP